MAVQELERRILLAKLRPEAPYPEISTALVDVVE
jgi:hypothetical protein